MRCGAKFKVATQTAGKDRHFSPDNLWKYLTLYVNKSLQQTTDVEKARA